MHVNFSGAEYDMLATVAHFYGRLPAPLVHQWTTERLADEYLRVVSMQRQGIASWQGSENKDTALPSMPSDAQP